MKANVHHWDTLTGVSLLPIRERRLLMFN